MNLDFPNLEQNFMTGGLYFLWKKLINDRNQCFSFDITLHNKMILVGKGRSTNLVSAEQSYPILTLSNITLTINIKVIVVPRSQGKLLFS